MVPAVYMLDTGDIHWVRDPSGGRRWLPGSPDTGSAPAAPAPDHRPAAGERRSLVEENQRLKQQLATASTPEPILGKSPGIQRAVDLSPLFGRHILVL